MKKDLSLTQNERQQIVDELLTVQELTAALKVKQGWVYQRIHAGSLPFPYCKVGAFLRFPAAGVQKYLEVQMRKQA